MDAALAVAVTAPMLGAILTSAIVASETGTALDVAVFLSAVPRRARVASQTLVVLCLAAGVLVCATFGGVLGGTASSIRQGSGVLGSGNLLAPAAAALALLWWVLLFVAAAVQRLRLVNLSALFLSIPVFLLLVPALKEAAIGRLCLLFFPLSPWWGFVHGRGSDDYAYTTGDAAIPLLCLWAVVAVLLVRRSLQRRPY